MELSSRSSLLVKVVLSLFSLVVFSLANAASPDYDLVREAGDIKGAITVCGQAEADIVIYAPGTSFSAVTDGGGNFKLSYVQQGTYDLVIKKNSTPLGTVSQVTVIKKQTVDIGTNNFCIDLDNDGYSPPQDCDDTNPAINPGVAETCGDGIDNNCNSVTDEGCMVCTDNDLDSFFAQTGCGTAVDCDDSNPSINPQAVESCDGIDNNCNDLVDESGASQTNFYRDMDGDGFGTLSDSILSCGPIEGYVSQPGDCNDADPFINPAAIESCDGIDNNCDGIVDDGFIDVGTQCSAGEGICERVGMVVCDPSGLTTLCNVIPGPPEAEVCNGLDDNCNGLIDDNVIDSALCPLQEGVCSGSASVVCINGSFSSCDETNYGPGYELIEVTCDGQDNDCNGEIDEVTTSVPNGSLVCQLGGGQGLVCDPGFDDCDLDVFTGCETSVSSDPNNCGSCFNRCPTGDQDVGICEAGVCTLF